MYKFPPGVGIPPEDVGEVQDVEDYWIMKDKVLDPSSFAKEAKEYIDAKLKCVEDYFERLEGGCLTAAELKERCPDDFDDPYYPTPCQLKVCVCVCVRGWVCACACACARAPELLSCGPISVYVHLSNFSFFLTYIYQ